MQIDSSEDRDESVCHLRRRDMHLVHLWGREWGIVVREQSEEREIESWEERGREP